MKKTLFLVLLTVIISSCKDEEEVYPTTYTLEYGFVPAFSVEGAVTFVKETTGNNSRLFLHIETTSDVEEEENLQLYLVENSIWEFGEDIHLIAEGIKPNATAMKEITGIVSLEELSRGNHHLELRGTTQGYISAMANSGTNARAEKVHYQLSSSKTGITNAPIGFRSIVHGVVAYFTLSGPACKDYYASKTNIQLISGSVEQPGEIIYDNLYLPYSAERTCVDVEHYFYGQHFPDHTIDDMRNIDAHVKFIDMRDSSIIAVGNIGINAQ